MIRLLLACFLLLAPPGRAAEKKLRVLATFLPAYCFAANVAGGFATVENLLPGGVSLHDFQLTPAELRKMRAADLIVVNGLGMETFLDRAFANAGAEMKGKIVTLTAGLGTELIREGHEAHRHEESGHDHGVDPHTWLDPRLAMHGVTNILQALSRADPEHAAAYAANAARFVERLQALDAQLARMLAPVAGQPLITYHNAFRYFARRYGLEIAGVVEQVPEVPPSPRDLQALHQTIRARQAKALFTEPGARTRLATQIARDAGIGLAELDPLETGTPVPGSYEEGMRRNAETLRKVLGE